MSDTPDEPTVENEPVESESAADLAPPRPEDAAPRTTAAPDTVTRRGAGLAMAGCLVVGLLLGWGIASATNDDGDSQPISFQGGPAGGEGQQGGGFHGGPGEGHGFPGPMGPGGFPGGPEGPGGGFDHHGGFPGGPPGYDEDGDEGGDDDGERGTDEREDEDEEAPSTTEGGA